MKVRKKPVVIEAVEITKEMCDGTVHVDGVQPWSYTQIAIKTLEGTMLGNVGDMMMTGVVGEKYVCARDVFERSYEIVDGVLLKSAEEYPHFIPRGAVRRFAADVRNRVSRHDLVVGAEGREESRKSLPVPFAMKGRTEQDDAIREQTCKLREKIEKGRQLMMADKMRAQQDAWMGCTEEKALERLNARIEELESQNEELRKESAAEIERIKGERASMLRRRSSRCTLCWRSGGGSHGRSSHVSRGVESARAGDPELWPAA